MRSELLSSASYAGLSDADLEQAHAAEIGTSTPSTPALTEAFRTIGLTETPPVMDRFEILEDSEAVSVQTFGADVFTGSVTTLEPAGLDQVTAIHVLEQPEFGTLSVNPDNTLDLSLSGTNTTGEISFSYQATYGDGSVQVFEARQTVFDLPEESTSTVSAGRVTTLVPDVPELVESVQILEQPEFGNLTVNPDNSLALVLTQSLQTGEINFKYQVTYKDGLVQTFAEQKTVTPASLEGGWGKGDFYMLETDASGDVIVETGDIHRKIHISGASDALSRANIAALEGLQTSEITTDWLIDNPDYGNTPEKALDVEAGMAVWAEITGAGDKETSTWLLFEKGFTYDPGQLIGRGISGEGELHPLHITSYGNTDDAIITGLQYIFQETSENIVFSDLRFADRVFSLSGENIIFDGNTFDDTVSLQNASNITIRNSQQYALINDTPVDGSDYYHAHLDRVSGIYAANSSGILLEGNFWDQIGWEDGYAADGSASEGHAPSQYSQNVYIQGDTLDVTFRDNITMRGASFGAQLRSGAFVEDNLFLDNNAAVNVLGGTFEEYESIGNFTLFSGNVVTSGAHKEALITGAKTWGVQSSGENTFYGNIITHLADPNNPDDLAAKETTHTALSGLDEAYYDDTIIYNWAGLKTWDVVTEANTEGLNTGVLDQTTIQLYAASLLGMPTATIADLAEYLRSTALSEVGNVSDADIITAYFQESFGLLPEARLDAETLRFVPNDLGDGIRWDNRLNWSTEDLPGTLAGDSVTLAGNWVTYGGTTTIDAFDFGSGGKLDVTHGKLTVTGTTTTGPNGATLSIDKAGQVWMNGFATDAMLTLDIDGGRFANTGMVSGHTETHISGGQVLLAVQDSAFDIDNAGRMTLDGSDATVGFEGEGGTGVLRLDPGAELIFVADENGFSSISEFRSGAFEERGNTIQSGINLNLSTLKIDVTALGTTAADHILMEVDALIGDIAQLHLNGLSDTQDAEVIVDYTQDIVLLRLLEAGAGSGALSFATTGNAQDARNTASLWTALTDGHGLNSNEGDTRLYLDDVEFFI